MDHIERVTLDAGAELRTSWIYALSKSINLTPSLYLEAGAIHGCVLFERDRPLIYMEDVGRHNAIDKIAGYMHLNGDRKSVVQGKRVSVSVDLGGRSIITQKNNNRILHT